MTAHKKLPHLRPFNKQPVVFLTVVTHARHSVLDNAAAHSVITAIWEKSPNMDGWYVGDYILMPDHIHLFARAALDAKPLARWIQTWKSLSARALSQSKLWQPDYFDRFVRSADDYAEKWEYVASNPVRKGLCLKPENWPWKGRLFDLQY